MSIKNLIENYSNNYRLKPFTPEWIAYLTRTANSRQVSTTDWNIAMDDIRKIASDSMSVNQFLIDFATEFGAYYNRAIKSIEYVTDPENYINFTQIISDKQLKLVLNETSEIENLVLTLDNFTKEISVRVTSYLRQEDGELACLDKTYEFSVSPISEEPEHFTLELNVFASEIVIEFSEPIADETLTIVNCAIVKPNTVGKFVITRYDGIQMILPTVNPGTFTEQMQGYVEQVKTDTQTYKQDVQNLVEESEKWAVGTPEPKDEQYQNSAKYYSNAANQTLVNVQNMLKIYRPGYANGLATLDDKGQIFAHQVPALVRTEFEPVYINWDAIDDTLPLTEQRVQIREQAFAQILKFPNGYFQKGDMMYVVKRDKDNFGLNVMTLTLMNDSSNSPENWVEENPYVVGSAIYAEQAKSAENSNAVNGIQIFLVEEIPNNDNPNAIYIMKV